ncbi:VanW family protein [Metabacillus herbersteinensis]|uniref:VanW family protein n=1 Tax=Metabacillus herbersteinensis TaxID=283816 RepID=A0ABV6GJK5_9BACI
MGKFIIPGALAVLVLLSGCSLSVVGGKEKEEIKTSVSVPEKSVMLEDKKFDATVSLIDGRNGDVLSTFLPLDVLNLETEEKELKQLASNLAKEVDKPMVPKMIDKSGQLTEGKNRVVLDEEKMIETLKALSPLDRMIELPIVETIPNVTADTIKGIDESVIGSYKTTFDPSVAGRSANIELSAGDINQIILGPGDRFYFNLITGDRTPERGYQKAMEIVNKEFVEGYGGGICQTSSTLYNAVTAAGLEILEVHNHSRSIGYVPAGKDATVAYGFKDLKFMNNKNYPIMIKTNVDLQSGSIEVQILAAKQYVKS